MRSAGADTHTRPPKLCFHTGVQAQPAAGKTSANYSPRAAFAAQPSMLFDAICLEFEKLLVSLIFPPITFIIPFVQAAFYADTKWHFLMDGWTAKSAFKDCSCYTVCNNIDLIYCHEK